MTIPLRDDNPSRTTPFVNIGLIVLNCLVFVYEIMLGEGLRDFMFDWGLVPERLGLALHAGSGPLASASLTLVTSMFLHGGWAHLLGNMWYLWIFGDNIEDRLGHTRYLLFYLAGGIVAALIQYASAAGSAVPTVGASGAIAAVLGAYAIAFPHVKVTTLIPLFPFFRVVALPALLVLGLWFVFQFFSGALSLAWSAHSGIAWWAHIGGFVFGIAAMKLLDRGGRTSSAVWVE